jgi:hypothetical protein
MMFDDRFHPSEPNDYASLLMSFPYIKEPAKSNYNKDYDNFGTDVGRGYIYKNVILNTKKGLILKKKPIPVYASGFTGSKIRNAVTGQHMQGRVGRVEDERQYIKVKFLKYSLATKNNSQTLFFEDEKSYKETFEDEKTYKGTFDNENII